LIAIPTEQAPRDFVENHQAYANRIFVACIKRWPITSLHPFGTLVEQLGEMGDIKVETDALLRDNNFGPDEFSDAVLRNVGFENWTVDSEPEEVIAARKDLREEHTFSILPKEGVEINNAFHMKKVSDGVWEIGVHVADVTHFVKPTSLVDREAKKRGTAVELVNRYVPLLPQRLAEDLVSLKPGQDRFAYSIVFNVDEATGKINGEPWIGKSIVKNDVTLLYDTVDSLFSGDGAEVEENLKEAVGILKVIEALARVSHAAAKILLQKFTKLSREHRYGVTEGEIPPLRLLYQTDDENVPKTENVFESRPAYELVEELLIKANQLVAEKIAPAMPEKALLRRQSPPHPRRLTTFGDRINRLGYNLDTSSSAALQSGLFKLEDADVRKVGFEVLSIIIHCANTFREWKLCWSSLCSVPNTTLPVRLRKNSAATTFTTFRFTPISPTLSAAMPISSFSASSRPFFPTAKSSSPRIPRPWSRRRISAT
jgi:protein SSD1